MSAQPKRTGTAGLLILVRHAHALSRQRWEEDDGLRPLSPKGQRQAQLLAARLSVEEPGSLLSSPAVRCRQTLEPLATELGRSLELVDGLGEGSPPFAALSMLLDAVELSEGARTVVACSHGDVLDGILVALEHEAVDLAGLTSFAKASALRLELDGRRVARAEYLAPPAIDERGAGR